VTITPPDNSQAKPERPSATPWLAVVLLIIVVLVLLYIFRADLGLGGSKTVIPDTVNVNVNHS